MSQSTNEQTSQDPDEIRAEIERTRADLSRNVDALGDSVNPRTQAQRQVEKVKDAAGGVREKLMGTASDLKESGGSAASGVGDAASAAPGRVKSQTQGNPLAAGLIAFGLGALAAGLIPTSRKEQDAAQAVKEKAQPLVHQATDAAKEVAEELRQPAQDAVASVKETATDAAQSVKDEGQSAVQDVRSQATDAKDTVQQA